MDIVSFAIGMSAAGDKTELLENVEIPVDFSNGNQTVETEEGKAIKSAVIQKPETLVAENIAKDINIAGIIGTLESGGGEENSAEKYIAEQVAEVVLPNAESIKPYAFYNDTTLTDITMPKVKGIGQYAFYGCSKLALTSLPSELTYIKDNAFYNCANLALTFLPDGIAEIRNSVFSGCKKLAFTSLPNSITFLGASAFSNCTGLTSITFKGKLESIYSSTFYNCTNLTTINVPWAEGAVANAPWGATNATINYNYTGG